MRTNKILHSSDSGFKIVLSVITALSFVSAVVILFFILYNLTDYNSGKVYYGNETGILILYLLIAIFVASTILLVYRLPLKNPFNNSVWRGHIVTSFLAGLALLYDFVRQSIHFYELCVEKEYTEYIYIVIIGLHALFALAAAFYFIMMALAFNTSNYKFNLLGILHITPFLWTFTRLLYCLSFMVSPLYSVDSILNIFLAIVMTLFFLQYIFVANMETKHLMRITCLGFICSFFAFLITIPRFILYFLNIELYDINLSTFTYFFIGIFILVFSINIISSDRQVKNIVSG